MNFTIALLTSLFLGSMSKAIYIPGDSEKTVYKCDNATMKVQVTRNFEDQYKVKMSSADPIGFELFVEELVTRRETQSAQIFASKKIVLKLDNSINGKFPATLILVKNPNQSEQFKMSCELIFSIMNGSLSAI
jgi:hypothetical protein